MTFSHNLCKLGPAKHSVYLMTVTFIQLPIVSIHYWDVDLPAWCRLSQGTSCQPFLWYCRTEKVSRSQGRHACKNMEFLNIIVWNGNIIIRYPFRQQLNGKQFVHSSYKSQLFASQRYVVRNHNNIRKIWPGCMRKYITLTSGTELDKLCSFRLRKLSILEWSRCGQHRTAWE